MCLGFWGFFFYENQTPKEYISPVDLKFIPLSSLPILRNKGVIKCHHLTAFWMFFPCVYFRLPLFAQTRLIFGVFRLTLGFLARVRLR